MLAAVFVVAGASLHATAADRHLFVLVNALGPGAAAGWSALSVLGLGLSGYIVVGLGGPRHARLAAAFLLALVLGGLAVQLMKSIAGAPRPLAVLGAGQVEVIGVALLTRSMPSGHAASIAALATLWIVDTAAARGTRSACVALIVAAPFAVAVGASRLAVGAHWPADVLVGAGLGVAVATLQSTLAPLVRARDAIAGWLAQAASDNASFEPTLARLAKLADDHV
jgi:undecaprenyl-diphosphatase